MHKMQTVAIDDLKLPSVCKFFRQYVCLLRGFAVQTRMSRLSSALLCSPPQTQCSLARFLCQLVL